MRTFEVVVAATFTNGIGMKNKIPWKIPGDMEFFKDLTTQTQSLSNQNAVIMGRKTWDSLPKRCRPLPNRRNIVLTGKMTLNRVLKDLVGDTSIERIFVIGGGQVYEQAFEHPQCTAIHMTRIHDDYTCDTFIPNINKYIFKKDFEEVHLTHTFQTYNSSRFFES